MEIRPEEAPKNQNNESGNNSGGEESGSQKDRGSYNPPPDFEIEYPDSTPEPPSGDNDDSD